MGSIDNLLASKSVPRPIDFNDLSLALDRAEALLSAAGESIAQSDKAELRTRISRARAELDFLAALSTARSSAKLTPLWTRSSGQDGETPDRGS